MNQAPIHILVVGGQSRAALAFRRIVSTISGFKIAVLVRRPEEGRSSETIYTVSDYFQPPSMALDGIDAVVNFVGIVRARSESEQRTVNAEGPIRLAALAKQRQVQQFVQISSLSVYGDATDINRMTPELPVSAYGRSKKAGDDGLAHLADKTFTVTLLRIPMVYGRSAGAKLHRLASVMSGVGWLPVPSVVQPRSILHIDNLASAIVQVVRHRLGGLQFASDPEPFSLQMLADVGSPHRARPATLVQFPDFMFVPLRFIARSTYQSLYGRSLIDPSQRLIGSELPFHETREGLVDLFSGPEH